MSGSDACTHEILRDVDINPVYFHGMIYAILRDYIVARKKTDVHQCFSENF
jgi:hypothetical protein